MLLCLFLRLFRPIFEFFSSFNVAIRITEFKHTLRPFVCNLNGVCLLPARLNKQHTHRQFLLVIQINILHRYISSTPFRIYTVLYTFTQHFIIPLCLYSHYLMVCDSCGKSHPLNLSLYSNYLFMNKEKQRKFNKSRNYIRFLSLFSFINFYSEASHDEMKYYILFIYIFVNSIRERKSFSIVQYSIQ